MRNIYRDTREHGAIHHADREAKKTSTTSDTMPRGVKHSNPYHNHLCATKRPLRRRQETSMGRHQRHDKQDMKRPMVIWCADANGNLGGEDEEGKRPP